MSTRPKFSLSRIGVKYVNDTFGHQAGDELLVNIASKLKSCVCQVLNMPIEEDDFNNKEFAPAIARLGGDEFMIFVPNIPDKGIITELCDELIFSFKNNCKGRVFENIVTGSVGVSLVRDYQKAENGEVITVQETFRRADVAMYRAKNNGKDSYANYEPEMDLENIKKHNFKDDLIQVIENDYITVYFQSLHDPNNNNIYGAEALVRWIDPARGMISPAEFLPLAAESNKMHLISEIVFDKSISQAANWPLIDGKQIRISVNASPLELVHENFVEMVLSKLDKYEFDPEYLTIEITENTLFYDCEKTQKVIQKLCKHGIHLAVDDFGIGYSNLARLSNSHFNILKLDRSLISKIGGSKKSDAIIQSIIHMSHVLDMNVVAEGIETQDQYKFLVENNCEALQGFLLSKPKNSDEFQLELNACLMENKKKTTASSPKAVA